MDLYNSALGTWSTAQLSVARLYFSATSFGNVAIFAGGRVISGGMRYLANADLCTLGHRVFDVFFSIALSDRFAAKSSVPVTIAFTPTNHIPSGGTITLSYPSGFFASSITPVVAAGSSSVAGLTLTCGLTTAMSVVLTTSGAAIGASRFSVTMIGFKMGAATAGASQVSVKTSTDVIAATPVSSGPILSPKNNTASMSLPRAWMGAVSAASLPEQNLAFFAGGESSFNSPASNIVDVCDGAICTSVQIPTFHGRFVSVTSLPAQGLVFVGSATGMSTYNAANKSWALENPYGNLPSSRRCQYDDAGLVGTSLPEQGLAIFVCGGAAHIYNANAGNWATEFIPCCSTRMVATSLPLQGLALFAGGEAGDGMRQFFHGAKFGLGVKFFEVVQHV